jgi:hypothetical protein
MWSWIKGLFIKELIYGVIDESKQKKNWLGFTLLEIVDGNTGFLVAVDGNTLELGLFTRSKRVWRMPFSIGVGSNRYEFEFDLFYSGCISYYKNHKSVFLYTAFWKHKFLDKTYLVDGDNIEYDTMGMDSLELAKLGKDRNIECHITLADENGLESTHKAIISYTVSIWVTGKSKFTRWLMSLFVSKEVISVMRIDIYNDTRLNTSIGINTREEMSVEEMLFFIVETNRDRYKKIKTDKIDITVTDDAITGIYG